MRDRRPILLALSIALGACSSCDGEPVPFGLDSSAPGRAVVPDPADRGPTPGGRAAITSRALPDGTLRAEASGAPIEIAEGIRAIAEWDLDGDTDRDAIVIAAGDATRGPRVLIAIREGGSLGAPREIAALPLAACTIDHAAVRSEADAIVVAEIDLACAPDDLGSARVSHAIALTASALPRVLERFALRAIDPADRLRLRVEDRDGDGVPDLLVDVTIAIPGVDAPADVTLAFLDRPAGLAREPTEPEARIAALAQEARGQLRQHRDRALAQSTRAVALYDAICREPERARLEVGGTPGLACGRSAGAGRALAILAQASAPNDALGALDALERMASPSISVRDTEREAARAALDTITDARLAIREGPIASAPEAALPRLSALAFLDEDRLLLRGAGARVIDLASGTEEPAGDRGSIDLVDPSGAYRLVAIERRCEGSVLVIGASAAIAAPLDRRTSALLAPRRAPPGANCPELPPSLRSDDDGWIALGWAPQGVLAARGTELRMVPLDLEARPAGMPVAIEPGAIPPAPIAPGHASTSAERYVTIHEQGVVLVTLGAARTRSLLRPPGWTTPEGSRIDVAVSPSGRRIAWISAGRVRWIERAAPEP